MAEDGNDQTIDLASFVPESFKGEDGSYDTTKFRAQFDELLSFKSQADERVAALPKEASAYVWALPEGHAFPEGFDVEAMKTKDEQGNEVAFDAAKMLDQTDPDVAEIQGILLKAGVDPALMGQLASVWVNRDLRGVMDAQKTVANEMAALGNEAQAKSRIDTVNRALSARMPKAQSDAVLNSLTSADAVRGIEALLKSTTATTATAPQKVDTSNMKPEDKILLGLQQREQRRA